MLPDDNGLFIPHVRLKNLKNFRLRQSNSMLTNALRESLILVLQDDSLNFELDPEKVIPLVFDNFLLDSIFVHNILSRIFEIKRKESSSSSRFT